MLRYFAYSVRNFHSTPDYSDSRLNWEFWITLRGRAEPRFHDGIERKVPAANFWIFPPGTRYHWVSTTEEVERIVVHFAYVAVEIDKLARERGFVCRTLDATELEETRALASSLQAVLQRRDGLSSLHFQRAMLDLSLLALRREPSTANSTLETQVADRAERALLWYLEHLDESPKFERIAAEMHISSSHLRRMFHLHFGKSPKEVMDSARLERAVTLLNGTTATLDDISRRAGFHSTPDFCRVFKKYYHCSPNVWRRGVNVVKTDLLPETGKRMCLVFSPGDSVSHAQMRFAPLDPQRLPPPGKPRDPDSSTLAPSGEPASGRHYFATGSKLKRRT